MWQDWFHDENAVPAVAVDETVLISPRLLTRVDLSRLSPVVRDFFEERAAIREFDGNMSRQYAEAGAWDDIQPYIDTEKWSFDKWIDGFGYCPPGPNYEQTSFP